MRESGYYWVLLFGVWGVALFDDNNWFLYNTQERFSDSDFDEIYENRIVR